MSTDSKTAGSSMDVVKWLLAVAFLAAAVVGNYMYADAPFLYRILAVVVLMLVSAAAALTTFQGKAFMQLQRSQRRTSQGGLADTPGNNSDDIDGRGGCGCYGTGVVGSGFVARLGNFRADWLR